MSYVLCLTPITQLPSGYIKSLMSSAEVHSVYRRCLVSTTRVYSVFLKYLVINRHLFTFQLLEMAIYSRTTSKPRAYPPTVPKQNRRDLET